MKKTTEAFGRDIRRVAPRLRAGTNSRPSVSKKTQNKMKKRISLLLMTFVAATMLLTGCKKSTSELILGTWTVDGAKSYVSASFMGQTFTHSMAEEGMASITFNSNGTVVVTTIEEGETDTDTASYTIAENKLTMTMSEEDDETGEVYTVVTVYDIDVLTESELVLSGATSMTEGGMTMTVNVHLEMSR